MIEDSKQWFKTLANLLERLNAVRPGENPSPYQVMTQVKKFLVIEKIGPEKLRSDLVAILDAGFMKQSFDEIVNRMRSIVRDYQRQQLNAGTDRLNSAMDAQNGQNISLEQMAAAKGAGRE